MSHRLERGGQLLRDIGGDPRLERAGELLIDDDPGERAHLLDQRDDSRHVRVIKSRAAARVLAFFDECGLIGWENRWLMRRAGVVA